MDKTQSTPSSESTILNDEMTRTATLGRLQEHLPLEVEGYQAASELIHEIALHAAVSGKSIEASCADLDVTIGANRVREHLNACLTPEKLAELEAKMNSALIDYHARPGEQQASWPWTYTSNRTTARRMN